MCIYVNIIESVYIVYMKIWMSIVVIYMLFEISTRDLFSHNVRHIKYTLQPIWFDCTSSYDLTHNME